MIKEIFTKHPRSINETYFQHFKFACGFGFNMLVAGFACVIHAIFPFLFQKTASDILLKMIHNFVDRSPVVEERLVVLSHSINSKATKSANNTTE